MGELNVQAIRSGDQRRNFYLNILRDIAALDQMLVSDSFESGPIKIGAEQELCLIDRQCQPSPCAPELLELIDSPAYTYELGKFNLEFNLDPHVLGGTCFSNVENEMKELFNRGQSVAQSENTSMIMAGILPTLRKKHLDFDYMVPLTRFKQISESLLNYRGKDFQITVQGVDDFYSSLDSILYEACNTSFQLHLQVDPKQFVNQYNWSQLIAGPVLATAVNSPLLFGKELWSETRIAIFKQSLDTRNFSNHIRTKEPRVSFGSKWFDSSFSEVYKDQLTRFPILLSTAVEEDPFETLASGKIPKLKAVRLHNGTTYNWNRAIYGPGKKKANLRIECRYLSAGPTIIDQMANFVFWIGLMKAMPEEPESLWKTTPFKVAKDNFFRAARYGLNCNLEWMGQDLPARDLCMNILIPMARHGLESCGVDPADTDRFLSVMERRVDAGVTGSSWTIANYRKLVEKMAPFDALRWLTNEMCHLQSENLPVHEWKSIGTAQIKPLSAVQKKIISLTSTDLFTIDEYAPIALADQILDWKNVNHIVVENQKGQLIGLVSSTDIKRSKESKHSMDAPIREIMASEIHSVQVDASVHEASEMMKKYRINSLPVYDKDQLVGIVTMTDITNFENRIADGSENEKTAQSIY